MIPTAKEQLAATPQEAYDEAVREFLVRERCFPKWVREGKIARSDARDRLARQQAIVQILEQHPEVIIIKDEEQQ